MPLSLGAHPRRLYVDNPLKLVICQVRYPVLARFGDPALLAPMQDALSDRYPRLNIEQEVGFAVGPGGATPVPPAPSLWKFRDLGDGWSVAIARDFLSIETTGYARYEELRERVEGVLAAAVGLGIKARERLGLRYVNEIRHPEVGAPNDWRRFINERLLGMVGGEELGVDVIHAIEEIRLREPDGILAVRHGHVGAEASQSGDAFYLLDVDFYDDAPTGFDAEETLAKLDAFHDTTHNLFEESVTDELRQHLGIGEEIDG